MNLRHLLLVALFMGASPAHAVTRCPASLAAALNEMRSEGLITREELPEIALLAKNHGWSANPVVLRAIAEELHSRGARSAGDVARFLDHSSYWPEGKQADLARSVARRISEMAETRFENLSALCKKLGISEADFGAFASEWRKQGRPELEDSARTIHLMLAGRKPDLAQGVSGQLPRRKWLFFGDSYDLLTKTYAKLFDHDPFKNAGGVEADPTTVEGVPAPRTIENDAHLDEVWNDIPLANRRPPRLRQSNGRDGMRDVLARAIALIDPSGALTRIMDRKVAPESMSFVQVDLSDGPRTFKMGTPPRIVTLTRSFEMQETPVTRFEWSCIMNQFKKAASNPNGPITDLSVEEIEGFISRMNQLDPRYNYRLPTEAEWEYMARQRTRNVGAYELTIGQKEAKTPRMQVDDPDLDELGTHVVRGGSTPELTDRSELDVKSSSTHIDMLGFRLVRTPK